MTLTRDLEAGEPITEQDIRDYLSRLKIGPGSILIWRYENHLMRQISAHLKIESSICAQKVWSFIYARLKGNAREYAAASVLIASYIGFNYGLYVCTPYFPSFLQPSVTPTAMIISMALIYRYSMELSAKTTKLFFRMGGDNLPKSTDGEFNQAWAECYKALSTNEMMGRNLVEQAMNYSNQIFMRLSMVLNGANKSVILEHLALNIVEYRKLFPNIAVDNDHVRTIVLDWRLNPIFMDLEEAEILGAIRLTTGDFMTREKEYTDLVKNWFGTRLLQDSGIISDD